VTDLTASIPRDVLVSAQQQWLPNLAAEMADHHVTGDQENSTWFATTGNSNPVESTSPGPISAADPSKSTPTESSQSDARSAEPAEAAEKADTEKKEASSEDGSRTSESDKNAKPTNKLDPPVCMVRILGQCLMAGNNDATSAEHDKDALSGDLPPAMRAGLKSLAQADQSERAAETSDRPGAKSNGGKITSSMDKQPRTKAADQTDDLLFPTEGELREIKARNNNFEKPTEPEISKTTGNASVDTPNAAANSQAHAAPVISIESDVDPESWAEFGGWYRQDYAIFYRPTGHKDKFIYSWLFLTGPRGRKGDTSPSAKIFDFLTNKDAQGSCTKCHSVDDIRGKGRLVNFSQPSAESKRGSFTKFVHEPHFRTSENRGCLDCHKLEKGRPYLKSYEQGDPHIFASNFGGVKKETCRSCHQSGMARQDCLLCHSYHVNGVISPIMTTRIPRQ
jgi:hypothetical protein